MVVMAVPEKETKFKDEKYNEIWYKIVDISQENGIPIWFLKDSKSIDESIETIVDRLYFFVENVKQDKECIRQFKESKKLEKEIEKQQK